MTQRRHHPHLTTALVKNFLFFVLTPILLIGASSLHLIHRQILESNVEQVEISQKSLVSLLDSEISNQKIELSRFLLSDDERGLNLITEYLDAKDNGERFEILNQLDTIFSYSISPTPKVSSILVISKDNRSFFLKNEPTSETTITSLDCYRSALAHKDMTFVGTIGPAGMDNNLPMVTCYSPGGVEYSQIEMVCCFFNSSIPDTIEEYGANGSVGDIYLLDANNQVICSTDRFDTRPILASCLGGPDSKNVTAEGNRYKYLISGLWEADLRFVDIVNYDHLLVQYRTILKAIVILVAVLCSFYALYMGNLMNNVIQPINKLNKGMQEIEDGDWDSLIVPTGFQDLQHLTNSFNNMKIQTKKHMLGERKNLIDLHTAEIHALQSQINPHFIVNSLESIRFMARLAHYRGIEKMADAIITIVSTGFRNHASNYRLRDEVKVIESYVYLMEIKGDNEFSITYDIEPDTEDILIPRLVLQPLVENSIIHGFEQIPEGGTIFVSSRLKDPNTLCLEIADTGSGFSRARLQEILQQNPIENGNSIGIANIRNRLNLRYPNAAVFSVESEEGKGVRIHMEIPAQREDGLCTSC